MSDEVNWIELSVQNFGVIIASVVVPFLLHHFKYKREREEMLFVARKDAYIEYFKKFEASASAVAQEYEVFSRETIPQAMLKLLESNNSPEAIVDFQQVVGEFPQKIQRTFSRVSEEMTSLKVMCSEELYLLIEQFEDLNQKMMKQTSEWLGEMQQSMGTPDVEMPVAKEMTNYGEQVKAMKNEIIRKMRKELGSGK